MKAWFQRVVLRRLWLTYIVLGLAFFAFGAGSLNLVYMFQSNLHLLLDYGWRAVMEGGALQLLDLLFTGYLSLAAYVVFKACEYRLSHWLAEPEH
ncbi:hypothetical protein [Rhodoferax sp.]|uniref:hypothetical protein n=1 Tax=Rhodoferax sp. TaxID=50421 RepID=UPI00374DBA73